VESGRFEACVCTWSWGEVTTAVVDGRIRNMKIGCAKREMTNLSVEEDWVCTTWTMNHGKRHEDFTKKMVDLKKDIIGIYWTWSGEKAGKWPSFTDR
jgi:hypothetical protein